MDQRPIGVFDSGVGGLSVVRELCRLLPGEDIVYFGDVGRVPYGTRSREVIYRYASEDLRFLRDRNVKLIIAACGTASSVIDSALTDRLPMPYTGVIEPTARAAAAATRNKKVGIIGHRRHHPQRLLCTGTPCHRPRHRNGGSGLCPAGAAGGKRLHRL